jgi:hypothetical protein
MLVNINVETPSKNTEKWSGYFKTEDDAQKHLDKQLVSLSKTKLILSAKKELALNNKSKTNNVECHGLHLFKFIVKTSDK